MIVQLNTSFYVFDRFVYFFTVCLFQVSFRMYHILFKRQIQVTFKLYIKFYYFIVQLVKTIKRLPLPLTHAHIQYFIIKVLQRDVRGTISYGNCMYFPNILGGRLHIKNLLKKCINYTFSVQISSQKLNCSVRGWCYHLKNKNRYNF